MSRLAEALAAAEQGVAVPQDFWSGFGSRVAVVLAPPSIEAIRDQENRIRVAIDDLVEFLNVMGAD